MLSQYVLTNAKPKAKPYKLADGGGLYALINPNGSKLWRLKYRFNGKEKTLAFGAFPELSIADAREKRTEARKLLAAGTDPSAQKKLDKIAAAVASENTFGAIAKEWLAKAEENGAAGPTMEKNRWLLLDLAVLLHDRPVTEAKPAEILSIIQKVEKSGRKETARRLRGMIGTVFRHAIVTLRAEIDPTQPLRGALAPRQTKHWAAITDDAELGALCASIDDYDGWPTIKAALQLIALTMTRPGEIRGMRRSEVNFPKAVWRIPAERTKMRREHDVPLSRQAIAVLQGIWDFSSTDLVLPSIRSNQKPLSENAMNAAIRRLGYTKDEMTSHGFRSSASSILNDRGFNPDVIEAALGHQDQNEIRRTYNRGRYWPQRVALMQAWADLLDEFRDQLRTTRKVA
ncbi:MAG: tyrosine-type recombinase/integrase [Alphaproteobacteria bacterium]|nr:tyrosine-type recombinase/integrase [Alphaproteobacteria bacterium]MCW5741625.1 tyrosine-type recombinase/integrase [Alphaproteobacteria bacterium]